MRSSLAPALFSSSCKAAGQEAIQFPLAHTHLHLEPSHVHFAWGGLGMDREPALCQLVPRGNSSSRSCPEGQRLWQSPWEGTWSREVGWHLLQTSIFCRPAVMFLWLPPLLRREGLNGSGEH